MGLKSFLLGDSQIVSETFVVRIELDGFLVELLRFRMIVQTGISQTHTTVRLAVVRIDFDRSLAILQCEHVVVQFAVSGRPFDWNRWVEKERERRLENGDNKNNCKVLGNTKTQEASSKHRKSSDQNERIRRFKDLRLTLCSSCKVITTKLKNAERAIASEKSRLLSKRTAPFDRANCWISASNLNESSELLSSNAPT